jgi:hypothetical protein
MKWRRKAAATEAEREESPDTIVVGSQEPVTKAFRRLPKGDPASRAREAQGRPFSPLGGFRARGNAPDNVRAAVAQT